MEKKIRFCPASVFLLIQAILGSFSVIAFLISGVGSALGVLFDFVLTLYFCIILFMKKRGIPTFIALALFALLAIIGGGYLGFLAYALLFVLALSACEKRIIKTDFFKKIHFVPGLLILVNAIISLVAILRISAGDPLIIVSTLVGFVFGLIFELLTVFTLGKWLAHPYVKGYVEAPAEKAAVEVIVMDEAASESAEA